MQPDLSATLGEATGGTRADFATGAATWRTRLNARVVFDSGLFPDENKTSSTKPEVGNMSHSLQRRIDDRVTATSNMYRKFDEI